MNGQTAKATRRDLRRAVGEGALKALAEQDQAIRWLVQEVKTLRADIAEANKRIGILAELTAEVAAE